MMETHDPQHSKVDRAHLARRAYLYVRQSSMRQVIHNTESTKRQYALRRRAVALGWPDDSVVVIDDDQAQSASSALHRDGFQRLVAEVGMGRAGVVMSLEVSRLARNNADWHRLLEICGLTHTLILDEDGVYDPTHFNDRLLLGLKGTMSEAELYMIRARLQGGRLSKARRGELRVPLPTGFVYGLQGEVLLDPDEQVQQAFYLFFQTFRREGTVYRTAKYWNDQKLTFPRRLSGGPRKGELVWEPLAVSRAVAVLDNPRFAGAYAYGRTEGYATKRGVRGQRQVPRERWTVLHLDAHEGYITWDKFEGNQRRIRDNARTRTPRRRPPREGTALLQGMAVCGRCGAPMHVRYHTRQGRRIPEYICDVLQQREGRPTCQAIAGDGIDDAVGRLLVDLVSPMTLEVTIAVQQELQDRLDEADRLRVKQVERARFEADLARRRYMEVDPANRLVADTLESDWNAKLQDLAESEQVLERQRQEDRLLIDEERRARILSLAADFPTLWNDPSVPPRERKRMARLLVEDVTLLRGEAMFTVHVRFKGGTIRTLEVTPPVSGSQVWATDRKVVEEIDRLMEDHTAAEIADIFRARGVCTAKALPFTKKHVLSIRLKYGLSTRMERLKNRGMLTPRELATELEIGLRGLAARRVRGDLAEFRAVALDDAGHCMYERLASAEGVAAVTTRGAV